MKECIEFNRPTQNNVHMQLNTFLFTFLTISTSPRGNVTRHTRASAVTIGYTYSLRLKTSTAAPAERRVEVERDE